MTEVPEEFRLSYYMGEIVIRDSFAEHEARVFWKVLYEVGIVGGKRPEMFGRLLPQLETAVQGPGVPTEFRDIAAPLLESTRVWHKYRRDLVHDLLVTGWGRGDDVMSATGKHPPRPMHEMKKCAAELQSASYRLRGLYIIAPYWMNRPGDGWDDADNLRSWTRVAMGHIADQPNAIIGTKGPAPEPPGGWDAIVAANRAKREAEDARPEDSIFVEGK
jgi:hypothetical protein